MDLSRMQSVDRFCHQYFQLESHLDFPDATCLRLEQVQNEIYDRMFSRKSLEFGPPVRYRVKTLKELSHRIESAIDDWEEHVRDVPCMFPSLATVVLTTIVGSL